MSGRNSISSCPLSRLLVLLSFWILGTIYAAVEPEAIPPDLPQTIPATATSDRKVAFVFEDGPSPQTTAILLDALKNLGMKATFAVTAENVDFNPGLARRIVAEGHELANHGYSHPDLKKISPQDLVREIQMAEETIMRVTGAKPRYFRSTNGEIPEALRGVVEKQGYEVLDSTLDSGDWRNPSQEKLMRAILAGAQPGSVILAHESFQRSAKAMPAIFDSLVKRGFVLCTASDLHPTASNPTRSSSYQLSTPSSNLPDEPGN